MPILVDRSDPGMLGGLAYQAGGASGHARALEQLRAVGAHRDAMILEQRLRSQAEAARRPSFYERAQMGGGGGDGDGETIGGVRTFVNDEARADQAEREKVYGRPEEAQSREKIASIFDTRARTEADPGRKAANLLIAEKSRRGEKVDDNMMQLAGFKSPADVSREAETARKGEADRQKAATDRRKAEMGPQFRTKSEADAHEIAYRLPAQTTARMLQLLREPEPPTDPLTGKPDPNYAAAITVQRMLDAGTGMRTGEVMARLDELRKAGAPVEGMQRAYAHVTEVWGRAEKVRTAVEQLAQNAAAQVAGGKIDPAAAGKHAANFLREALERSGVSPEDYSDYLADQERRLGLRPMR